jgi:hypothetical protein
MKPQDIPSGFAGLRCLIAVRSKRKALNRKHNSLWAQLIIHKRKKKLRPH